MSVLLGAAAPRSSSCLAICRPGPPMICSASPISHAHGDPLWNVGKLGSVAYDRDPRNFMTGP